MITQSYVDLPELVFLFLFRELGSNPFVHTRAIVLRSHTTGGEGSLALVVNCQQLNNLCTQVSTGEKLRLRRQARKTWKASEIGIKATEIEITTSKISSD